MELELEKRGDKVQGVEAEVNGVSDKEEVQKESQGDQISRPSHMTCFYIHLEVPEDKKMKGKWTKEVK